MCKSVLMTLLPSHWLKLFAAISVVVLATGFPLVAKAADVYVEGNTVNLEGDIRQGDAERVVVAVLAAPKQIIFMSLNSKGGDLMEAMRIVALVKDAHWNVSVGKGHGRVCVSACFFIFLAGESRSAGGAGNPWPQALWDLEPGIVGIHRPYFNDAAGNPEAPKKQEELMRKVRDYLNSAGVSQYLVDEMMSRPSNDIYWLKDRDLDAIGDYNAGIEEALIATCGYKRSSLMAAEKWSQERMAPVYACVAKYLGDKNRPLQLSYVAKLRTGWRPWKK